MSIKSGSATAKKAFELAAPLAESLGLQLYDVVFEKEGAAWYLRIYIDKDGGISLEDCEAFSRPFNKILDENDFIAESYIFEAGSPGLGRTLRTSEHFQRYIGQKVKIRYIRATDAIKEFTGTLLSYTKEGVVVDGKIVNFNEVSYIKLDDF